MIPRYSTKEMEELWSEKTKVRLWLDIELSALIANESCGKIPDGTSASLLPIDLDNLISLASTIEVETKHDVGAFVKAAEQLAGPAGKFIHYGLTSSDIVDTTFSLRMVDAINILLNSMYKLKDALLNKAIEYKYLACAGRTHGQLAEPTTFGLKLLSHHQEIDRNIHRLISVREQVGYGKLSGAVGNYYNADPKVEALICDKLGLHVEPAATQIIPRDRYAEVFSTFAIAGAALERLALNIRLLQQSGIAEVTEDFGEKQVGSSAMPHKKNPILSENICGAAKMLRAYAGAALENIALWNERDISHSSVERIIAPDACNLFHFAILRMTDVINNISINKNNIRDNLSQMSPSSRLLKSLIDAGISRDEAYKIAQSSNHKESIEELSKEKVDEIFYRCKV